MKLSNSHSKLFDTLIIVAMILSVEKGYAMNGEISGMVTNGKRSLPYAKVTIKTTKRWTTTDRFGRFTFDGVASSDTLIVTAWTPGYYNGEAKAVANDTNIVITLNSLPREDNADYEWRSPEPDSTNEFQCGNCHADVIFEQWRTNAHANSATNPFFLALYYGTDLNGHPDTGVGYKRDFKHTRGNCATCHIPGAAANNPWGIDPKEVTGASQNGVFCDFCHKVYRVKPSTGQGTTGVLSIELLRPPKDRQTFFGPYVDVKDPDSYSPLIQKSEFCSPCHTGKFWGIPAYNSFPEWQASPYPLLNVQCQTCHMAPDGVTTNFAPGNGGFERAPSTIPSHLLPGSRDPDILTHSVTMQLSAWQQRDSVVVMVTIINDKAGHHVPTGRPSRNMILLVEAQDKNASPLNYIGTEKVPVWGGLGEESDGIYAGLAGKGFAKILEDFQEHSPAPSWRQTRILSDNRIAAFVSDTSYYYFEAPTARNKIAVSAKLIYRRFFKPWMDEKKFDIPDIEMENEMVEIVTTPIFVEKSVKKRKVFHD
ncbi:MAG: carboxypeptidase regulatory-like domain-containing protein [bacterium]